MYNVLFIGLGGFLGATSRYFIGLTLPYGTLTVNLVGCLLFGVITALTTDKLLSAPVGLFLLVGFIGAFTTFSAYSFESLQLLQQGKLLQMLLNIALQTTLGIFFIAISFISTTKLISLLRTTAWIS